MKHQPYLTAIKTAVLFAVSFVLLSVIISIWRSNPESPFLALSLTGYGLFLFYFFQVKQLALFGSFAFMLLDLNDIIANQQLHFSWKMAAVLVLMLHIGALEFKETAKLNEG